jgi:salicylate hydroxylase
VTFNARVASIDPDNRNVTLSSGKILSADVVIGADGLSGISRQLLEEEEAPPQRFNMYR